jgi:glycosyltransferase involved in cell wall biosynthesis
MKESIGLGLTTEQKCLLAPNSINNNLFKVMNKSACRKQLGFPQDIFIVAFVGWFKHIKGPKRIAAALDSIEEGENVYSIFIGAGKKEEPQCKNIIFKGRLMHDEVPVYLNAADVFVLPTLNEGCCNSIVEAMACGLPIISSNLPFNWDILSENNSILIDPNNINEIAHAIVSLRDDKDLRNSLSQGSLKTAMDLTIDKRAAKIEAFIKEKCKL